MTMAKSSDAEAWGVIKEIGNWLWPYVHEFANWLTVNMVMERWKLAILWGWSVLSATILSVVVWQVFANRTWKIEDSANRLQWRMLRHPKSWAYVDLRADPKELKELIGGSYHYNCGGEIRFVKDPAIGLDRPVCSRCDRATCDSGVKAAVPVADDRLAVGREMQRQYRTGKRLSKTVSLDWV
jgi:hypothetical protein